MFLISIFVPQPFFTVLLATTDVGSEGKYVPKYILQWLFWILDLPIWLCQADQHSKHLTNKTFFCLFTKAKYKTYLWRQLLKKNIPCPWITHTTNPVVSLVHWYLHTDNNFFFFCILFKEFLAEIRVLAARGVPWYSWFCIFVSDAWWNWVLSVTGEKAWAFLGNKFWICWCKWRCSFIITSWAGHTFLPPFFLVSAKIYQNYFNLRETGFLCGFTSELSLLYFFSHQQGLDMGWLFSNMFLQYIPHSTAN